MLWRPVAHTNRTLSDKHHDPSARSVGRAGAPKSNGAPTLRVPSSAGGRWKFTPDDWDPRCGAGDRGAAVGRPGLSRCGPRTGVTPGGARHGQQSLVTSSMSRSGVRYQRPGRDQRRLCAEPIVNGVSVRDDMTSEEEEEISEFGSLKREGSAVTDTARSGFAPAVFDPPRVMVIAAQCPIRVLVRTS